MAPDRAGEPGWEGLSAEKKRVLEVKEGGVRKGERQRRGAEQFSAGEEFSPWAVTWVTSQAQKLSFLLLGHWEGRWYEGS